MFESVVMKIGPFMILKKKDTFSVTYKSKQTNFYKNIKIMTKNIFLTFFWARSDQYSNSHALSLRKGRKNLIHIIRINTAYRK